MNPLEPSFYEIFIFYIIPALVVVALALFIYKIYKNSKKDSNENHNGERSDSIDTGE